MRRFNVLSINTLQQETEISFRRCDHTGHPANPGDYHHSIKIRRIEYSLCGNDFAKMSSIISVDAQSSHGDMSPIINAYKMQLL